MNTSATTQPKAFILTLSNELLDIIAVHLLTDLSALSKFSQTCRELEAIARPVMFKSFSEPDGSEREADKGLQVFLESIQQNSKLGAYVRNLRITDLQCSKDAEDSHHGLFSAFMTLAPKSLDISTIVLVNSGIAWKPLLALLAACKGLKFFSYACGHELGIFDQTNFGDLVDEIQSKHGGSMERIGRFDPSTSEWESEHDRDYLRDLEKDVSVKFPKLKQIRTCIYEVDLAGFDEVIKSFAAKGVEALIDWYGVWQD
ncbi:hypothetical protein BLS_004243 [Venturia inaequalis]|uniref:Uncharacterized protein n=1 Tax=Venturia inaequalis TaxID=5025 RepID=A0A8H3YR12_VENIN|nr:hypothetical protein EG328_006510 [Venturia inaequalis]KAE9971909.1 hypothetical protein BLS_004243 [Venturia inaequalis]KAE9991678.1 hypothetical protein EG327_011221 [Venturia inaequalis]